MSKQRVAARVAGRHREWQLRNLLPGYSEADFTRALRNGLASDYGLDPEDVEQCVERMTADQRIALGDHAERLLTVALRTWDAEWVRQFDAGNHYTAPRRATERTEAELPA